MKVGRITEIRSPVSLLPQAYIPDMEMMGRQSFYLLVCSKISFKNVCLNMRDFLDMVCHPLPSNTMQLLRYFTNSLLDTDDKRLTHFSSNLYSCFSSFSQWNQYKITLSIHIAVDFTVTLKKFRCCQSDMFALLMYMQYNQTQIWLLSQQEFYHHQAWCFSY